MSRLEVHALQHRTLKDTNMLFTNSAICQELMSCNQYYRQHLSEASRSHLPDNPETPRSITPKVENALQKGISNRQTPNLKSANTS